MCAKIGHPELYSRDSLTYPREYLVPLIVINTLVIVYELVLG